MPTASERGAKSKGAHKWARWLHNPCRLGGTHRFHGGGQNQMWPISGKGGYIPCHLRGLPRFRAGGKIRSGPQVGKVATQPLPLGVPHRFRAGGKIRAGPQVGKVAAQPLPPRGSPLLQSKEQNQRCPTSGQGGYITPRA